MLSYRCKKSYTIGKAYGYDTVYQRKMLYSYTFLSFICMLQIGIFDVIMQIELHKDTPFLVDIK